MEDKNLTWHRATVTRTRREDQNGHRSAVIWFTGLSGSGKSTISHAVEEKLFQLGGKSFVLDGDNIRHGLCSDLGFSAGDRHENIRRIGEVSKLFVEAGVIVLTAFISPFTADREMVRDMLPHGDFLEIYCQCSLETCEKREVKGLYKKARSGLIKDFTGISSPYEAPVNPELTIDTEKLTIDESVNLVMSLLKERNLIRAV